MIGITDFYYLMGGMISKPQKGQIRSSNGYCSKI